MKHCFIVKFVEGFDYKKHEKDIKSIFDEALSIEGIKGYEIKENCTLKENRSDIAVIFDMEDSSALERWAPCKPHMTWKEKYTPYILSKAVFDYED